MAALVQSFPQQTATVTMLQTRPASASGPFQNGAQSQQQFRGSPINRNMYNVHSGGMGTTSHRGQTSIAPVAPYAFTSPPPLTSPGNPLRQHPTTPHLRVENRTSSAPVVPFTQQVSQGTVPTPPGHRHTVTSPSPLPIVSPSTTSLPGQQTASKDDSAIVPLRITQNASRPLSMIEMNVPDLSSTSLNPQTTAKPSPDRYRRANRKPESPGTAGSGSAVPSGSGMATVGHLYSPTMDSSNGPASNYRPLVTPETSNVRGGPSSTSRDDMTISHRPGSSDLAKRYRRRSVSSLEASEKPEPSIEQRDNASTIRQVKTYASVAAGGYNPEQARLPGPPHSPHSSHGRKGSDDSAGSSRTSSRPSSVSWRSHRPWSLQRPSTLEDTSAALTSSLVQSKRDAGGVVATANPTAVQGTPISKAEAKLINIPPRGSSDANKRLTTPSPLSKPMTMPSDSSLANTTSQSSKINKPQQTPQPSVTPNAIPESPAAQQLAALSKKEEKKAGKTSRLRRAFSFGSAAELRKASAENSHHNHVSTERARLQKSQFRDEEEAEQAAIVQKQEAAGLGEGIYSGQGHFFTGSTDNLSISSTASSASIMIRKMGKGMKKSTRSLVGLFRPKSVIGVPAADAPVPDASTAQVSMVTIEAERERVNVNPNSHLHEQPIGGTGYPKLERNSLDAASAASTEPNLSFSSDNSRPRRSIVGGEKERSEVLAAVKKGILKRKVETVSQIFCANSVQVTIQPVLRLFNALRTISSKASRCLKFPASQTHLYQAHQAPRLMTMAIAPRIDPIP